MTLHCVLPLGHYRVTLWAVAVRPDPDLEDMLMADYPDIYADGFSVTAGPFGVTLTLQRSEPMLVAGAHEDPSAIVGRIRMSPNLAKAIADGMNQMLLQVAVQPVPSVSSDADKKPHN